MERRSTAAIRYAEAVFQVARDQGNYDTWLRELGEVEQILSDRFAAQVLLSPVVPRDRKSNILELALPDLNPQVRNFLEILVRRERLTLVPRVLEVLRQLIAQERGLATARVTTALPLSPEERRLLATRLATRTGKQIQIEENIDPGVIGGVVVQIGDEIIDGSVRGRLEALRRVLVAT